MGFFSLMSEFAIRKQTPIEIWIQTRQYETEKRQYTSRALEVEQATFTSLVFSTISRMAVECN